MRTCLPIFFLFFLPLAAWTQIDEHKPEFVDQAIEESAYKKLEIPARFKTGKPELFAHKGRYGYVLNDSVLVPPIYKQLEKPFSDGMIAINEGHYFGVVNRKGEIVLPFDYILLTRMSAGAILAAKQVLGYGLLDAQGRALVPLEYRYGHAFPDSTVVLHGPGKQLIVRVSEAGKIDTLLEAGFEAISKDQTGNRPLFTVQQDGLWGLMDYEQRSLLPCVYDKIHLMHDHQVVAEKNGKWGVVTIQGDTLVPFEHDKIRQRLRTGYYPVGKALPNGKWHWGLADSTGQVVIRPEYDHIEQLYNSNHFKLSRAGKKGLANEKGQLLIPVQFDDIYEQKHPDWGIPEHVQHPVMREAWGRYVKTKNPGSDLLGLWDLQNGEILKPGYEWFDVLRPGGPFAVQKNGKKALVDGSGQQLTGFEFGWLGWSPLRPEILSAGGPDQKRSILRVADGQPVQPEQYDEITTLLETDTGYLVSTNDRLSALHAPDGRRLTAHQYTWIRYCEKPASLGELPPGRNIVACAGIHAATGLSFFALDDTGAAYPYRP